VNSPNVNSETGTIGTGDTRPQVGLYIGRFAPSPTGPLHFGSLLAATASFLEAQKHGGRWLLRVEDIDPPREQPGAAKGIVDTLAAYGFEWHGEPRYQSTSHNRHDEALGFLLEQRLAYYCGCSRSDLETVELGDLGPIYPGTCRGGTSAKTTAIRIRTDNTTLVFTDGLQGTRSQRLEADSGDFIIRRKDKLIAYQLAVVVDDNDQGVTDIVRGIDLLDSTPRQIWLQKLLGYPTPNYVHIPIAVNAQGQKLSKNTGADGISLVQIVATLLAALTALGQAPPAELATARLAEVWGWARENWNIDRLRGKTDVQVDHKNP